MTVPDHRDKVPVPEENMDFAGENSGKLVSVIREHAKKLARKVCAEHILSDGPPGIGCPAISSMTGTDLVVAVTEPSLSGWSDLERLIQLAEHFHSRIHVIINKYDLNPEMSRSIKKNLEDKGIDVPGMIPYDETMVYAMVEKKTIIEYQPEGRLANELKKVWKHIQRLSVRCISTKAE